MDQPVSVLACHGFFLLFQSVFAPRHTARTGHDVSFPVPVAPHRPALHLTRRKLWVIILSSTLTLFLIEAASARLCKMAFSLLFAGVLIWFFCRDRRLLWVPVVMLFR